MNVSACRIWSRIRHELDSFVEDSGNTVKGAVDLENLVFIPVFRCVETVSHRGHRDHREVVNHLCALCGLCGYSFMWKPLY